MKKVKLQMLGLSVNDLLSREQMKKVMGGSAFGSGAGSGADGCTATATCYKTVYNSQTHNWDQVANGSVGCSGATECNESAGHVSCKESNGTYSTGNC